VTNEQLKDILESLNDDERVSFARTESGDLRIIYSRGDKYVKSVVSREVIHLERYSPLVEAVCAARSRLRREMGNEACDAEASINAGLTQNDYWHWFDPEEGQQERDDQ